MKRVARERYPISLLLVCLLVFVFSETAFAHETKTDGSLSVLLHMEPQDSPVVGEPAQLFFAFTDSRGDFDLRSCDCEVSIRNRAAVIFKGSPEVAEAAYGTNVGLLNFTFPKKGIYTVKITGSPATTGNFSPFALSFDVRIERESMTQEPINPLVKNTFRPEYYIYALGAVLALGILIIGFHPRKIKRKK